MGKATPIGVAGGMGTMRETGTTAADSTIALNPQTSHNRSKIPWHVTRVEALPDFKLIVEFVDGTRGTVRMREMIFAEKAGVFISLRDEEAFQDVFCDDGHVEWANGLDLAPDAMHDRLIAGNGEYTVKPYTG
jgi:hypothetical protein